MGGEAKVTAMVMGSSKDEMQEERFREEARMRERRKLLKKEMSENILFSPHTHTASSNVADKISKETGGTIKSIDIKSSQTRSEPPGDKLKDGPGPVQHPPPQQKQGPPQTKPAGGGGGGGGDGGKPKAQPQKMTEGGGAGGGGRGGDGGKLKVSPLKMADGGGGGGGGNADKRKKIDFAPTSGPPPQQQFPMGPPKLNQPAAFMSPESIPVAGYPSIFPPVVYHDGGPYYQNQGMSEMAPPQRFPHGHQPVYQYDGYYTGRPVGNDYLSDYFSEESPSTCSVM